MLKKVCTIKERDISRNEEEKKKIEEYKKPIIAIIIFFILAVLVIIFATSLNVETDYCSMIRGTPAWIQGEKVIGYGYKFPERYARQSFEDTVNDYLIPNEVTFVYDLKCPHCLRQIEFFKQQGSWQDYLKSGLTKECEIL